MAPITFFSPQDAKKGGAGIEDLPAIMSNSIDTTLKHLSNLSIVTADKGESSQGSFINHVAFKGVENFPKLATLQE